MDEKQPESVCEETGRAAGDSAGAGYAAAVERADIEGKKGGTAEPEKDGCTARDNGRARAAKDDGQAPGEQYADEKRDDDTGACGDDRTAFPAPAGKVFPEIPARNQIIAQAFRAPVTR
mgnify:CR=1 FL=1